MKKSTTPQLDNIPQAPGSPVRNKLFNKTEIKLFSKEVNNPENNLEKIQFQINFILLLFRVFSSADASLARHYRLYPIFKSFPLLQWNTLINHKIKIEKYRFTVNKV